MQDYSVKRDGDTPSEKHREMSKKTKKEKKMKNGKELSSGLDVDLKYSQREAQDFSGVQHEKTADEPYSKTEPSDEGRYNNEGSMECEPGDGSKTVVYTTNHDDLTEVETLDKLIDDAVSDLEVKTEGKTFTDLDIFLPFDAPLSHTIESKITHGISEKEHNMLKELNINFKTGRFNPEEDNLLRQNWKTFSKRYDFTDPGPFLPGVTNCLTSLQRKKFVQWLGKGLENRSLNSIYSRFRLLFSNKAEMRRFTVFEDKLIKRCMERNVAMPFVVLSSILNRDRMYISKHYRLMHAAAYSSEVSERVHWDMNLIKLFIETLLKTTGCRELEELRDASLPPNVWNSISEKLEIPASRCRNFWNRKLSTQLFAEEPIYRHQLCTTLLLRFWKHRKKYIYWQDIKWSKVAKHYKGIGPVFLAKTFKTFVHEFVPEHKHQSLKACLKFLRKHWFMKLPEIKFTLTLTRLRYINGQLTILTDK